MAIWAELKVVLAGLREQQPGPLVVSPGLEGDASQPPPFAIWLAPWAVTVAGQLHRKFGADVDLTVGALPYPPGSRPARSPAAGPLPKLLDPREIAAELDGPAVVRSGHELLHGLVLGNPTGRELQFAATGPVRADVVDPQTHEVVGGLTGPQPAMMTVFRVGPGETMRVPFLIGTGSLASRLGYTVPAGSWGVQTTLALGASLRGSPRRRTPVLPLTITS